MIEDDKKPSDSPLRETEPAGSSERRARRERRAKKARQGEAKGFLDSLNPWIEILLCLVVFASVTAVGTVHLKTLMFISSVATIMGVLALRAHRVRFGCWPVSGPAWIVLALTVFTCIQVVPIHIGILSFIAPHNASVWAGALGPLGEPGPSWVPISLDPTATWAEVLKGITYFSVLIAATNVSSRRGAGFGLGIVFISGLIVAALTLGHGLSGLEKVYGIYEPQHLFAPWHIGPLLNPNHLCGYLNLSLMCGLGILLMKRPPVKWSLIAVGVVGLIGLAVASASRGGVVLIPIGVGAFTFLIRKREFADQPGRISRKAVSFLALGALVGGGILAILGLTMHQWEDLLNNDLSKLSMISWCGSLIADYPLFGIGRGAFESVFQAYRQATGPFIFTHPENILVQWVSEWGIIPSLAAIFGIAWYFRPWKLGVSKSALMAGAWLGLVMLLVQNWVDFSSENPSVGIAVACVIGSLWGDHPRRGIASPSALYQPDSALTISRLWPLAALLSGLLLALTGLARYGATSVSDTRLAFSQILRKAPIGKESFHPLVRLAFLRFPAEPFFPLVAAERAYRARDENPLPYLDRAISRGQTNASARHLEALILAGQGATSQAMISFRMAASYVPEVAAESAARALRYSHARNELDLVAPTGKIGGIVYDTIGGALLPTDPELSVRYDEMALARDPSLKGPRIRVAQALVRDLEPQAPNPRCKGESGRIDCLRSLEQQAGAIERISPTESTASQLRASAQLAIGKPAEAWRILEMSCPNVVDRISCLQAKIKVGTILKVPSQELDGLMKQIATLGCVDTVSCSQIYLWIGEFYLQQGSVGAAAKAYERAVQEDPENTNLWLRLGDLSYQLGATSRAVNAWEQASRRLPNDTVLRERIQTEKQKLIGTLHGF